MVTCFVDYGGLEELGSIVEAVNKCTLFKKIVGEAGELDKESAVNSL